MTAQTERVKALVQQKKDSANDKVEDILSWLDTLASMLDSEPRIEADTAMLLAKHARPYWGVRTVEEGKAYLAFWRRLVDRHPLPVLLAAYAAELLRGESGAECDALRLFTEAVKGDPSLFIEYSGDFVELEECGTSGRLQFELARIRFYTHLVGRGEMEAETLQEAVREILDAFGGDPSVRPQLLSIAREFLGPTIS